MTKEALKFRESVGKMNSHEKAKKMRDAFRRKIAEEALRDFLNDLEGKIEKYCRKNEKEYLYDAIENLMWKRGIRPKGGR